MSKRKPVVNLMEALKKSLDHLHREKPMTPENTPRMAERTDRQAQIDPWADVNEIELSKTPGIGFVYQASVVDAARAADAALLRERDAQIASLTAQVEGLQDKWTGGWTRETALAQVDDFDRLCQTIATLRAERDAAQQENTELRQARDEANAVIARYGFNGAKLQVERLEQENQTLREALHALRRAVAPSAAGDAPWEGMPQPSYFIGVAERMRAREPLVAALSSSPRPQEPQP